MICKKLEFAFEFKLGFDQPAFVIDFTERHITIHPVFPFQLEPVREIRQIGRRLPWMVS
jgi:hypothetical protein